MLKSARLAQVCPLAMTKAMMGRSCPREACYKCLETMRNVGGISTWSFAADLELVIDGGCECLEMMPNVAGLLTWSLSLMEACSECLEMMLNVGGRSTWS